MASILVAREHAQGPSASPTSTISPTDTSVSTLSLQSDDRSKISTNSPPDAVSKHERMFYYSGISPDPPMLVYRTGSSQTPWVKPSGPEAQRRLKQIRGVYGHKLNGIWSDVSPRIRYLLKDRGINWTSIDVARFITNSDDGKEIQGPVVLWIGVVPDSLQHELALASANNLLGLLAEFGIDDVEVEYRESIYKRSVGSPLLRSVSNLHTTVDVRGPLTSALGLPIATANRPDAQGTMALYFSEGGPSDKILGLTCHHVLFETDAEHNDEYRFKGAGTPREDVRLLGLRRFEELLASIKLRIRRHGIMFDIYKRDIVKLEEKVKLDDEEVVAEAKKELNKTRSLLEEADEAIEDLEKFFTTVKKEWGDTEQRTIGHIRYSSALTFDAALGGFTADWGAFELDTSRIENTFTGNFIDLGTKIPPDKFTFMMYPREDGRTNFKYPGGRLLPLRDIISEQLMRAPGMLDHNSEECLIVIKNGNSTGVTIGRATGIFSFVRDDSSGQESKEWAIYNYDNNSGVFSAPGDSGSIVVDGLGRVGGMLTGGTGKTTTSDVTYVTPMFWLWPRIKEQFPSANMYPTQI